MASLNRDIQDKLQNLNIFEKIIGINFLIFFVGLFIRVIFNINASLSWIELPSDFMDAILQPWAVLTYGFTHYDFLHILFNMIWIYFIGKMSMNLFPIKMGLNVYFLGIISGGLLFLLGYNVFPGFFEGKSRLVGASAGVRALLIFLCAYMPKMDVRFFTFNIKLWYIGIAIVIIDVLGLFGSNSGGYLAHLGGSLLGYFYAVQLKKGTDIGKGFENLMDGVSSMFKKSGKSPLKTVHRKKAEKFAGYTKSEFNELNKQKKIDVILDKIGKSGYDSLTKEEKEFLFKAGK
ncbi:rhomboid family intramembrane serine protease [Xanthomarina sp. F1114]|uniref:rhomboid family intramembrane serine protease n=1 Tax=Xanthomarina sp. F1114 TaxID=2996019 RepID=UPI00225E2627|nr:rhomboid family intramembrane serine protease [Xanthomarina sp. F1114]MCX7547171.1 rhomboid family intramembrane serine protease [Xanthomarina sp. F1114]